VENILGLLGALGRGGLLGAPDWRGWPGWGFPLSIKKLRHDEKSRDNKAYCLARRLPAPASGAAAACSTDGISNGATGSRTTHESNRDEDESEKRVEDLHVAVSSLGGRD
jgi:hypothetical protein